MRRSLLALAVWMMAQTFAGAGPLPAPTLRPGQFVYTVPEKFDPPMIGRAGMAEIQRAAAQCRYPYYVVLVDRLPGGTDDDAAQVVDSFAENWSINPRYNVSRSSIFLLSFQPRKFRFLAGAEWKTRLGFERSAHDRYTALFVKHIQGTPKDPKTGIIEMMKAVDGYLFDQTDPARIAARQEAERRAKVARELQSARSLLQEQSTRLLSVLNSPPAYLPADTRTYTVSVEQARKLLQTGNPASILAAAAEMRRKASNLEAYVQQKQMEERTRLLAEEKRRREETRRKAGYGFLGIVFLGLVAGRAGQYRRLKSRFTKRASEWDERVLNAKNRYVQFYGDHDTIRKLVDPVGATAELYTSVTSEVDAIFFGVNAMESHLNECRSLARRANFLRLGPLASSMQHLDGSFTFDTGQLNPADLFASETKVITVEPNSFFDELEQRFRSTLENWNRLKAASEMRYSPSQDHFPSSVLDALIARAEENGIPLRWLADHPLYGDDEADQNLYDAVNENRWNDPISFANRLGELKEKEQEITERIDRMIAAQVLLKADRLEDVPSYGPTILRPEDDPKISFDTARREEARFAGLVADGNRVEDVEENARLVSEAYRRCLEQAEVVRTALDTASTVLDNAKQAVLDAESASERVTARLHQARQVHAKIEAAESFWNLGNRHLDGARRDHEEAGRLLAENRHVEACRRAQASISGCGTARGEMDQCIAACDELDRQKRAFEEKARAVDAAWQSAATRMRRYGGITSRLERPRLPMDTGSSADYAYLLGLLAAQEAAWDREVRQAQRAYEAEQRRREQAAAEARRRAEEAAEQSRRSSSWSSSGHSGSSSSGGSWSSRSSSGSSRGSSSSGGSW